MTHYFSVSSCLLKEGTLYGSGSYHALVKTKLDVFSKIIKTRRILLHNIKYLCNRHITRGSQSLPMMGTYYENCVSKDRGAKVVKGHRPQYENRRERSSKREVVALQ